ncbi:PhoD-like phosphatase N-terminal domain-containing protein, partial [Streptomyces albiflaviniger]|nr:PhoD-like phosphatase N-terminal domain-containing protein [Streptomyces albiflaviniger]
MSSAVTDLHISRRSAVTAAAAAAALLPLVPGPTAAASGPAFLHGVASGDPLPDGILLWTRITPAPDAVPGSGLGPAVEVTWEVAEDRDFRSVVAHGTLKA